MKRLNEENIAQDASYHENVRISESFTPQNAIIDEDLRQEEIIRRTSIIRELIPSDVWVYIFQFINYKKDISIIFPLKRVCKQWNDFLINSPISIRISSDDTFRYISKYIHSLFPNIQSLTIETQGQIQLVDFKDSILNLHTLKLRPPQYYSIRLIYEDDTNQSGFFGNLRNLALSKTSQLFTELESFRSLRYLQKLSIRKIKKNMAHFFSLLKLFVHLKKLDIEKILIYDIDDEEREEAKISIQLFFENINQFEVIKFPIMKFIDCYLIQKNYPNVRFRWYTISIIRILEGQNNKSCHYEGDFEEDGEINKFCGRGVFHDVEIGYCYEGEWRYGSREGIGREYIGRPIQVEYEGEWKFDRKEGRGIQDILMHGKRYEGEWQDDGKHGKGILSHKDGSVYEGDFEENKKKGKGKHLFLDGSYYEGNWENDLMEGKGIHYILEGCIYEGEWKNGMRGGQGIQTYSDGSIYEGEWKKGKREGIGKMIYPDGVIYEGEWKDDNREGRGKLIVLDGSVCEGEWKDGENISEWW